MAIGKIIKKARQAKRLQIRKVAEMLHENAVTICKIENDQEIPRNGLLINLCMILDLDYEELKGKAEIIKPEYNKSGSIISVQCLDESGRRGHKTMYRCGECQQLVEQSKTLSNRILCIDCVKKLYPDYKPVFIKN